MSEAENNIQKDIWDEVYIGHSQDKVKNSLVLKKYYEEKYWSRVDNIMFYTQLCLPKMYSSISPVRHLYFSSNNIGLTKLYGSNWARGKRKDDSTVPAFDTQPGIFVSSRYLLVITQRCYVK